MVENFVLLAFIYSNLFYVSNLRKAQDVSGVFLTIKLKIMIFAVYAYLIPSSAVVFPA